MKAGQEWKRNGWEAIGKSCVGGKVKKKGWDRIRDGRDEAGKDRERRDGKTQKGTRKKVM